jgi:hypothetical protein
MVLTGLKIGRSVVNITYFNLKLIFCGWIQFEIWVHVTQSYVPWLWNSPNQSVHVHTNLFAGVTLTDQDVISRVQRTLRGLLTVDSIPALQLFVHQCQEYILGAERNILATSTESETRELRTMCPSDERPL